MNDLILINSGIDNYEYVKDFYPHAIEIYATALTPLQIHSEICRIARTEFVVILNNPALCPSQYLLENRPEYAECVYSDESGEILVARVEYFRALAESYPASLPLKYFSEAECIYHRVKPCIFFLSYKEPNCFEKYNKFCKVFPDAKHVHGIDGIFNAHKMCANLSNTDTFYVVDADAELIDGFNFEFIPNVGQEKCVHVWRSINEAINLSYGYGGVKLFPTVPVRNATSWGIDFSMSLGTGFVPVDVISNKTIINDTPFNAWKSAFRESTKLYLQAKAGDIISGRRLDAWKNPVQSTKHAEMIRLGVMSAMRFVDSAESQPTKINDYDWLYSEYVRSVGNDVQSAYYNYFWKMT